jgi:hypothetical protein
MTSEVKTLVESVASAAQAADFALLRQHWQSLYDLLRAGHPIEDVEAYRLVAALDEAGIFDHLAGEGSADIRKTIDEICKAATGQNDEGMTNGIATLTSYLDNSSLPLRRDDADRLLKTLRSARAFPAIADIAERLIARGQDHALLRRIYGQALIDKGQIAAGIEVLNALSNNKNAPADEQIEAVGILGRAYKQLYVNAHSRTPARGETLKQSLEFYRRAVRNRPITDAHWPMVNLIAMAKRGAKDGFAVAGQDEADRMASRIVNELGPRAERGQDPWELASMGEACVALGDFRKAAHWFGRYANHPQVTPFHLGSTIRQLEELWGIKADEPSEAGQMLMALKTRLVSKPGGEIKLTREECVGVLSQNSLAASPIAQSILGQEGPVRYEWLALGMQRPPAIARICRAKGLAEGTGFLVDPNQLSTRLSAQYPNELLLMTNIHVISKAAHPSAMTPEEARVYFDHDGKEESYRVNPVWESPQNELDAALLSLDPPIRPAEIRPCPLAEDRVYDQLKASALLDPNGDRSPASNVYIMGHPLGQQLCLSLHDTEVLDKGAPPGGRFEYLHYRTPTQRGHSGSPVFDDSDWRVVALHHAGSENTMIRRLSDPAKRHKANEGISIKAIRREVDTAFKNRKR